MAGETRMTDEVQAFLIAEARLLDERRFDEWEALFADDATYWVPIHTDAAIPGAISIIHDDRARLHERVYRLTKTPVLDQNPPSRTVRFVSNVEVNRSGANGEVTAYCAQLITEMRPGGPGQAGLNAPRWFAARCEYRLMSSRAPDPSSRAKRSDPLSAFKIILKKVTLLNSDEPHYNLSFIP